MVAMKKNWGFDVKEIDTNIRPQDDFYHYVNHKWMKENPIPSHESRWGSVLILRYETEKQLRALVQKVQKQKGAKRGSAEQMVRDFYISGLDMKSRNKLGMNPLLPWLKRIDSVKDVSSLVSTF